MAKPDLLPRPMIYEQIMNKDFTVVQVFWDEPYRHEQFVVGSPYLAHAKVRAVAAIPRLYPGMPAPTSVHYYPRTYVSEAKGYWTAGRHD
jgi:hypothetical protein